MRYVLRDGKLVPKHLASPHPNAGQRSNHAMSDIDPFVTVDGTPISSRSHKRAYMRANNLIEVGNEWVPPSNREQSPPVMPDLVAAARKHGLI